MKVLLYILILLVPCFSIAQTVEVKEKKGDTYLVVKKKNVAGPYTAATSVSATSQYLVKTDKWGIADDMGAEVVSTMYDSISYLNGQYYLVKSDEKYGIIDTGGTSIIEPTYEEIDHFTKELQGVVKYEGQWVEVKGTEVIGQGDSLVFRTPEEMPRFSNCDGGKSEKGGMQCDTKEMLDFIFEHIVYPQEAITSGIEGMVVVRFIVEKNGFLTSLEIVREIGGGCGEAALRVVEKMKPWVPGMQDGQRVRTAFYLPIKFKS